MDQLKTLRNEALTAFPRAVPPQTDEITPDCFGEAARVRQSLNGQVWWSLSDELIVRNFDELPLLSPLAFHYYFPAFLIYALDHFDPDESVVIHTVFSLAPFKTSKDDPNFAERINQFSEAQVNVVRGFLELILRDQQMYSLYNDAARGLKKFWGDKGNATHE